MVGLPAGGGVEEEEIGVSGNDADLEEVEDAEPIKAGGRPRRNEEGTS